MISIIKGYSFGLLAALIWGSWMAFTRMAETTSLSVQDITALRFGISGIFMLPILFKNGFFVKGSDGKNSIIKTLVISWSAGLAYVLFFNYGLKYLPTIYGTITPATMPIFVMIIAWKMLGVIPSRIQISGFVLSFFGVLYLIFGNTSSYVVSVWYFLFILAALSWAIYTVASNLWKINAFHGAAIVAFWSMLFYLPYYFNINGWSTIAAAPMVDILLQAFVQGILISIVALIAYNKAVAFIGATRASFFPILMPIFGTITAIPLLHEQPTMVELSILSIICIGLLGALRIEKKE